MKITINTNPKEIAALVVELQERRRVIENPEEFAETFTNLFHSTNCDNHGEVPLSRTNNKHFNATYCKMR